MDAVPEEPAGANDPTSEGRRAVRAPGIALIVAGAVHGLYAATMVIFAPVFAQMAEEWVEQRSDGTSDVTFGLEGFDARQGVVALLIAGLTIAGGWSMLGAHSRALAIAGAVATLVPCMGVCCGALFPIGVWALVVLMRPEVKRAFAQGDGGV